jgi:hypothetical protein
MLSFYNSAVAVIAHSALILTGALSHEIYTCLSLADNTYPATLVEAFTFLIHTDAVDEPVIGLYTVTEALVLIVTGKENGPIIVYPKVVAP